MHSPRRWHTPRAPNAALVSVNESGSRGRRGGGDRGIVCDWANGAASDELFTRSGQKALQCRRGLFKGFWLNVLFFLRHIRLVPQIRARAQVLEAP
jgi:hypothetical protein